MIRCSDGGCPNNIFDGCCKECPEKQTCQDSCTFKDETTICTYEIHDEEHGLTLFKQYEIDIIAEITAISIQKKAVEAAEKDMKSKLLTAMKKYGVKQFSNDVLRVTYVAPSTSTSIDSAKLKKLHPEIAVECSKTTSRTDYVKVEVK